MGSMLILKLFYLFTCPGGHENIVKCKTTTIQLSDHKGDKGQQRTLRTYVYNV